MKNIEPNELYQLPHAIRATDSFAACSLPEFPHIESARIDFTAAENGCRACLTALVAVAVNRPELVGLDNGQEVGVVRSALHCVRRALDDNDPLRVRAEQELVPLAARFAA